MKRAPFLTTPAAWLRASRSESNPIRYAAAVEHPDPKGIQWDEVAMYVLAAVTVALFAWGVI